jgi:hypothetical protein
LGASIKLKATWYKTPPATASLGARVFVNQEVIERLGVFEGEPVLVSKGKRSIQLKIYKHF